MSDWIKKNQRKKKKIWIQKKKVKMFDKNFEANWIKL